MKRVLILVISADVPPYDEMITTSLNTWDSINVEGVETLFYCGESRKQNTDKVVYLPIKDGLFQMGYKTIMALEYALKHKEFDYIARVNASCYVRKDKLKEHCEGLAYNNVFEGLVTDSVYNIPYLWGGGQMIYSKDVAQKIVDNKSKWNHKIIEDVAISDLAVKCGIEMQNKGNAYSINKVDDKWAAFVYGEGENMEFTDFADLKKLDKQYFIRVKQDGNRNEDKVIMTKLYEAFK